MKCKLSLFIHKSCIESSQRSKPVSPMDSPNITSELSKINTFITTFFPTHIHMKITAKAQSHTIFSIKTTYHQVSGESIVLR